MVVSVSGAVGGIGTSTFAFALSLAAGAGSVLIDGSPTGVPLDILIGAERSPGTRWGHVRVRSDDIAPGAIVAALPEHLGVRVLASDATASADPLALGHVVAALRTASGAVFLDLPSRGPLRSTLRPDLELLLVPPTLHGIAAARLAAGPLTQVVLVETGRADVAASMMPEYVGCAVLGTVRWQRAITLASVAGAALPQHTDAMQLAKRILETVPAHG